MIYKASEGYTPVGVASGMGRWQVVSGVSNYPSKRTHITYCTAYVNLGNI